MNHGMRISKALPILTISPWLHCSACRSSPLLSQFDISRPQSFPVSALSNFAVGGSSTKRDFPVPHYFHSTSLSASTFAYHIAASYSAKGRRFNPRHDNFTYNASTPLGEQEIYTGRPIAGQDAFFVSTLGSPSSSLNDIAFGVADGVGGWADSGFDSADLSHGLCHAMALVAVEERERREKEVKNGRRGERFGPKELLQTAYADVVEKGEVEGGGSTACVAVGRADGQLTVANLGDSGFVHLRPSAVHYNSNPQTHAFNTPYQLSIIPPKILRMSKAFGSSHLSDLPSSADVSRHSVRHGDVLVFATDGVWDNLSPVELLKVVSKKMMGRGAWVHEQEKSDVGKGLEELMKGSSIPADKKEGMGNLQTELAVAIVAEAKVASVDQKKDGPFAREVRKYYPRENWHGGKVDDICVVVAVIVEEGEGRDRLPVGRPKL